MLNDDQLLKMVSDIAEIKGMLTVSLPALTARIDVHDRKFEIVETRLDNKRAQITALQGSMTEMSHDIDEIKTRSLGSLGRWGIVAAIITATGSFILAIFNRITLGI